MNKTIVLLLVASLAVNLAAVITFGYYWLSDSRPTRESGRGWGTHTPDPRHDLLRKRLQLTEDQANAIEKERESLMKQIMSVRRESSQKRRELMGLLEAQDLDRQRADSLLEDIAVLEVDIERLTFEHLARMRGLLNPDQREHLLRMLERRLPQTGVGDPLPDEHFERRMEGRPRKGVRRGGDNGE